jgi:hypothetical protein
LFVLHRARLPKPAGDVRYHIVMDWGAEIDKPRDEFSTKDKRLVVRP